MWKRYGSCQGGPRDGRSKLLCCVDGCLLSLSLCRRGFQDLHKVRPSSLLCILFLPFVCHMSLSLHPPSCDCPAGNGCGVKLMKLLLTQFSETPATVCYIQILSSAPCSQTASNLLLPSVWEIQFYNHTLQQAELWVGTVKIYIKVQWQILIQSWV
jgi:hypothetical protein